MTIDQRDHDGRHQPQHDLHTNAGRRELNGADGLRERMARRDPDPVL